MPQRARCCCARALDARFVLYHHVIRRRVQVELEGRPFRRSALPRTSTCAGASGWPTARCSSTISSSRWCAARRAARPAGRNAVAHDEAPQGRECGRGRSRPTCARLREGGNGDGRLAGRLWRAAPGRLRGAPAGRCSKCSSCSRRFTTAKMRPVRRPAEGVDSATCCPTGGRASGSMRWSCAARAAGFAAPWSASRTIPTAPARA